MFRIIDLVEIDLVQGLEKKVFRLELFEDTEKPNIFRARLWEIQLLPVSPDRSLRFNGPFMTVDKSLIEKSILLPTRFTSPFASTNQQTAFDEVVAGFHVLMAATNQLG